MEKNHHNLIGQSKNRSRVMKQLLQSKGNDINDPPIKPYGKARSRRRTSSIASDVGLRFMVEPLQQRVNGFIQWLRAPKTAKVQPAPVTQAKSEQDDPHEKLPFLVIKPDSTLRLRWDLGMLILVLYYGFSIPVRIAFFSGDEEEGNLVLTIDTVATYLFVVDMVLNFRTAYRSNGVLITDPWLIAWDYGKMWFFIDLIAMLPIDKLFGGSGSASSINKVLRLLRVFKLFRVFRIARILKRIEEFTKFNPSVIRLGKIFIGMVFSWHWIASLYWFISDVESFGFAIDEATGELIDFEGFNRDGGNLWVPPPELWCKSIQRVLCNETAFQEFERVNGFNPFRGMNYCFQVGFCPATLGMQYSSAFFWAVMVTTGIGRDIMPVTVAEHVMSIVMIILGVMMYAVIIGSASSSLSNLDSEKTERRQKLEAINQYLRQRQVPHGLQKRIRAYYEYMWSSHQSLNAKDGVLSDLHRTLSLELHISLNRKLIEKVPMFKMISDSDCVIDLIEKLVQRIYIPGEYLVLQGELGSEMFIIVRGTVHVLVKPNAESEEVKHIATLQDGDVFGEHSMLNKVRRSASMRASTYCDTLILSKEDFDVVLSAYPEFSATLHKVAAKQAFGWDRIRAIVKLARSVTMFGESLDMRKLLLPLEHKKKKQMELHEPSQRQTSFGIPTFIADSLRGNSKIASFISKGSVQPE